MNGPSIPQSCGRINLRQPLSSKLGSAYWVLASASGRSSLANRQSELNEILLRDGASFSFAGAQPANTSPAIATNAIPRRRARTASAIPDAFANLRDIAEPRPDPTRETETQQQRQPRDWLGHRKPGCTDAGHRAVILFPHHVVFAIDDAQAGGLVGQRHPARQAVSPDGVVGGIDAAIVIVVASQRGGNDRQEQRHVARCNCPLEPWCQLRQIECVEHSLGTAERG